MNKATFLNARAQADFIKKHGVTSVPPGNAQTASISWRHAAGHNTHKKQARENDSHHYDEESGEPTPRRTRGTKLMGVASKIGQQIPE